MAMAKWHRPIQDEAGNLITSSLQVTVRHQATAALATLFADRDGVSNKSNPFTVTDGEPFFYAVGGMYSVRVVGSGYDETFSDQPVGTGAAVDADSLLLPGYLYEFETTTTAPPSAGSIRANNADLSAATELYIDDDNVGGTDFSAIFLALDPGTKSQKNRIILTSQAAGQQVSWDVDGVSDESGYVTLTVSGHVGVTTLPVTSRINAVLQLSGPDGVHPGFHFVFDGASTADSDPGAGKFRLNNADPSMATAIYIDNVETLAGASVTTWLDSFDDGLNSIKGELAIIANSDASIFLTYNVTGSVVDGTGYRKLTVEYVAHGGTLNDATLCVMEFVPRGDAGVSPGYRLTMDAASTTDSDPGAGKVRFNHGTFGSITEVYVDNTDQGGGDITGWLDGLDDVVNANARAYLRFQSVADPDDYAEFAVTGAVTDGTGYRKIPVSPVAGDVPADATVLVAADRKSGLDGQNGAAGGGLKGIAVHVVDTTEGDPSTDYEDGDEVDGHTLVSGEIVLRATSGGDAADGVYVVPVSGAASRHPDFDTWDKCAGAYFPVMMGTTNADTLWRCTSDPGGGTIDTDPLVFEEFGADLSAVNQDIIPDADSTRDLGDATHAWAEVHADEVITSAIQFPATQVPSSDANALDDYEEGTYTPSYNGTVGNGTLLGSYTKIGRVVVARFYLSFGSTTTANAGGISCGLPFNCNVAYQSLVYALDSGTAHRIGIARITSDGGSTVQFSSDNSGSIWVNNVPFTWATGDILAFTMVYTV